MSRLRALVAGLALVLLLVVNAIAATTTSTNLGQAIGPPVYLTVNAATTGDVVASSVDGTLTGKCAQIVRVVSNGETKFVLMRVQRVSTGVYVDAIAAETTSALATRIAAFDLSTAQPSHPSPTNDAVDDALSAAMVGYTGS